MSGYDPTTTPRRDARRLDHPPRRDTTNVPGLKGAVFILLTYRTCNAWYIHRIRPLTKPLSCPLLSTGSHDIAHFPLSLSLQKQDPDILLSLDIAPEISHITKPRYREISHITKPRYRQFPLRLRPSPPPRRSLGPEMTRARMRVMILLVKRERVPFIRSKSWSKKVCVLLQYL